MAIKKDTDKVIEKKNGMNIVDNMDGEERANNKLNSMMVKLNKVEQRAYDNYLQSYKPTDDENAKGNYSAPLRVYILPNYTSFGVSPRPNTSEYTISYNYYQTHTDLSAHGDNMSLPDRFSTLIVDRAKYYTYMLRSDPQHAQLADRDFQRKLRLLKVDYATKNDYMRSDSIAESIATNIGGRVS